MTEIKRGQVFYADLSPIKGSEQGGHRPVVIIQNNVGNKFAPTVIVAIMTTRTTKSKMPTHYWLQSDDVLPRNTMVMLEQIRTIDKSRLKKYLGKLPTVDMANIDKALKVSLELGV